VSEEQVKEVIERIGYQEFYRYYEDKDVLIRLQKEEIERLNNIIKEVKEEIEYFELQAKHLDDNIYLDEKLTNKLLEILDKENK